MANRFGLPLISKGDCRPPAIYATTVVGAHVMSQTCFRQACLTALIALVRFLLRVPVRVKLERAQSCELLATVGAIETFLLRSARLHPPLGMNVFVRDQRARRSILDAAYVAFEGSSARMILLVFLEII